MFTPASSGAIGPPKLLDLHGGDAPSAAWTLDATLVDGPAGYDIRGPYIQGGPGQRFIYLSWGSVDDAGSFSMFRRAKLLLADVAPEILVDAQRSGTLLARRPHRREGSPDLCPDPPTRRAVVCPAGRQR
jgi:hypothetical protein